MTYKNSGDLTGHQYSRWTVISVTNIINSTGYPLYKCKCVCGTEKLVDSYSLQASKSKSCGCYNKERNHELFFEDLSGRQFNRLTVLRVSEDRTKISNKTYYECQCSCGNLHIARSDSLKNGAIQSCGCLNKEIHSKIATKDLTDKKFGRWTVISRAGSTDKKDALWLCKCICGNEKVVNGHALRWGKSKSCGCLDHDVKVARWYVHGKSRTKEYGRAQSRKRRELKILYDLAPKLNHELEVALEEFFSACVICGMTRKEHIEKYGKNLWNDHVLPLSKGYGLVPGNAVVLCGIHNQSKKDKDITELPLEWQINLIWNAFKFKDYWENLQCEV